MTIKKMATNKATKRSGVSHPGMMGGGTEEQNLNEQGDLSARIARREIVAAFGKKAKVRE